MCTWNFHIDWILWRFLSFLDLVDFSITRNSVLKIMKNFDLNIENVLFIKWNFVFTIMIYNIVKEFC